MWDSRIHVCKPFEIPQDWLRFRAMDWGSYHPYSVGWYAVDFDGKSYRYRELYGYGGKPNVGTKETAKEVALKIAAMEKKEQIAYGVLDNACWNSSGTTGPTIAEEINKTLFEKGRPPFRQSEKGREHGAEQFRIRLTGYKDKEGKQIPGLVFFDTCVHAIRTIPMLTHDKHSPEKYDTSGEDHIADEIIYSLLSRPWKPEKPKPEEKKDGWRQDRTEKISWMAY